MLKPITKNLVLCYDGDNAGVKAINNNLPLLLKEGFNVSILPIPNSVDNPKMDIDDLGRYFRSFLPYRGWGNNLAEYIEYMTISWVEYKIQAFAIEGKKDKVTLVEFAGHLTDLILSHPDKVYQEMFINEANNRVLFLKTTYKSKLKEQKEAEKQGENEEVRRVICNEEETKVINARGVLATIGNFQIKILYKIAILNSEDCKWFLEIKRKNQEPVTLIVDNKEFKPQNLEMLLYAKDFSLDLDDKQFKYLKEFLQKEGYRKCLEIRELGYHAKSNLFFFSNCAYHTITKKLVYPNSLNIIDLEDISYLMPYANREFSSTDKIACYYEEGTIEFEQVADFIMRSWGENAVLPIAYYFASLFMDIAISRNKCFPVLFLKGEGSTGKTKLANLLMDFFGTDMSRDVGLAAASSAYALKDRIKTFANIPIHLEDYSHAKDIEEMESFIIHAHDRKLRKTKDMAKKGEITDEIPLSSIVATSNEDPRDIDRSGALPSRLIYIKMTGNNHDPDKMIAFNEELAEINAHQRAHITLNFLSYRELIEKEFDIYFLDFLKKLSKRLKEAQINVPTRVTTNYAALITPLAILGDKDIVNLPDGIPTHVKLSDALLDIAYKNIVRQVNSLLSKSPLQTFWETVQGLADEANYQISRVGTYLNSKGEEKPKDVNINNRLIYKDYHYKVWQFHDKGTIRVIDEPVVRLKFQDIYDKYFLKMKERGETKIPSALHIKDLLRNHRSYVPDVSETQLKYKDDGQSSPVKMGFILKYNALKDDFDVDFE